MADTAERNSSEQDSDERDDAHLEGIEEGAGCTEIWEHLAENRGE